MKELQEKINRINRADVSSVLIDLSTALYNLTACVKNLEDRLEKLETQEQTPKAKQNKKKEDRK